MAMPAPPRSTRTLARAASTARREAAAETERVFIGALEAGSRSDLGTRKIKAPPPRERVAVRFGGGTRARTGEYDWFYELNQEEQARIRTNWMTDDRHAVSPDEIEDMGLPMGEWLSLTRGIDAARAVQTGRDVSVKRYGGRNPLAYIVKGDPEDFGERVEQFTSRRPTTPDHTISRSDRVQFFTDKNGVVHPIRASYEQPKVYQPTSYLNAYGQRVERRAIEEDDEAF